jgi:TolA-binding protein
VTWLFVIVVILVLGAGFAAALGLLGGLPDSEQDLRPDTRDGEPSFDVVVRGYRMDEVDAQLQAMQGEIDALRDQDGLRDQDALSDQLGQAESTDPMDPSSAAAVDGSN